MDWRGRQPRTAGARPSAGICMFPVISTLRNLGLDQPRLRHHPPNGHLLQEPFRQTILGVNLDLLGKLARIRRTAREYRLDQFSRTPGAPRVDLVTGTFTGLRMERPIADGSALATPWAGSRRIPFSRARWPPNGLPVGLAAVLISAQTNLDASARRRHRRPCRIAQEYLAGTDPNDPSSNLRITSITHGVGDSSPNDPSPGRPVPQPSLCRGRSGHP